jgi:hypothetical protein
MLSMFVLTKPASSPRFDATPEALDRVVSLLASDIEETSNGTRYKISGFTPFIRYSMFAPFSEVELDKQDETWLLKLRVGTAALFPFAIALVAFLTFRTIGPIRWEGVITILSAPTLVVLLAVGEARLRVSNWWRSL